MEMSSTERLILVNQYKLMALLDPTNAAKYQRLEVIVKGGAAWNCVNWTMSFQ